MMCIIGVLSYTGKPLFRFNINFVGIMSMISQTSNTENGFRRSLRDCHREIDKVAIPDGCRSENAQYRRGVLIIK